MVDGVAGEETPARPAARPPASRRLAAPPGVNDAAGVILAVFAWLWVGLPLLTGGPSKVKDVLRAKFFNKRPDGGWLP